MWLVDGSCCVILSYPLPKPGSKRGVVSHQEHAYVTYQVFSEENAELLRQVSFEGDCWNNQQFLFGVVQKLKMNGLTMFDPNEGLELSNMANEIKS